MAKRVLVKAEAKRVSEGLASALTVVNLALEDGASAATRRSAARTVQRALHKFAEAGLVWDTLIVQAAALDAPQDNDVLIEAVGDLLTTELAVILAASGYRTPPPPAAHKLVEETRVRLGQRDMSKPPTVFVESVRAELRQFVGQLEVHMHSNDYTILSRVLRNARKVSVNTLLLGAASCVELKTGSAFDVNIGASVKDLLQVEVTVPWSPAVVGGVIAAGALAAVRRAVTTARAEEAEEMRKRIAEAAQDRPTASPG